MGFLTDEEIGSLQIDNMILHVVGEENFVAQQARVVEHEEFFIDRIHETDIDGVFEFEATSQTKRQVERIAARQIPFEEGAQELSREFSRLHLGNVRDGAFFVFELSTAQPNVRLYSLVKYDYNEVIEQSDDDQGLLRRIVHAFIEDRKAVQKSALIRVVDNVTEDVISARDRVKRPPDIGDYFAAFLDVTRNRNDEELNQRAVEVVRETLRAVRDVLPNRDVARAFRHAKEILRDRQEITADAIGDAIIAAAGDPEDENIRSDIYSRTRRKVRSAKLEGLTFPPDRQVLRRPPLRRLKTTEGIVLVYPDEAGGGVVRRDPNARGGETITIHTARVTEDEVVPNNTRRNP